MYIDETYDTFTLASPIADARLRRLCRRLDACRYTEEYLAVIRKIVRTRDPQAVEVLAAILDSQGPVGRAAAEGLVKLGPLAIAEVERVLRESDDGAAIVKAEWVLARLPRQSMARLAA